MKQPNIQNHYLLSQRLRSMSRAVDTKTDEGKRAYASLIEEAEDHERKSIFQPTFIVVRK